MVTIDEFLDNDFRNFENIMQMVQYALVLAGSLQDEESQKLSRILKKELTGYSRQHRLPKWRKVEDLDGNPIEVYAHLDYLQRYPKNYAFGAVIGYIESLILHWAGTTLKSEISNEISDNQRQLLNIPNGTDFETTPHAKVMEKVDKAWNKIKSIDTDKD